MAFKVAPSVILYCACLVMSIGITKDVSAQKSGAEVDAYFINEGKSPSQVLNSIGIYALMHSIFEHESQLIRREFAASFMHRGFSKESLIHLRSLIIHNPFLKKVKKNVFVLTKTNFQDINEGESLADAFVQYIESDFDTYETVILNTIVDDLLKEGLIQYTSNDKDLKTSTMPWLVQHFSILERNAESQLIIHTISLQIFINQEIGSFYFEQDESSFYRQFPVSLPEIMTKFQRLYVDLRMAGLFFASSQIEYWDATFQ